jgi:phosphoglycolate phosphatase
MNKKYKALIFDYDDTLVQTREIRYKTIKRINSEVFNYTITDREIDSAWGLPADKFLLKLFGNFSQDLNYLWDIYNNYKKFDRNQPHHYAFNFIRKYQDHFLFGIVTSSSFHVVTQELEDMKIDLKLFLSIQGAEHTPVHKPDPDVFLPIFEKLAEIDIKKNDILYIGDSPADFYSSSNFGINFLGIAHDDRHINFFKENSINFVKNFNELEIILNT